MTEQRSAYCRNCGRHTLHARESHNALLGCLLVVLTCGLWLPIMFLMGLADSVKPFICQACGTRWKP